MNLKVGDEVRVFDVNGQQVDGRPGTVTKVGRKFFTVRYGRTSQVFRLDTGRSNDAFGHQWVRTLEQAALDARRIRAVEALRKHKITLGLGHTLTVEQLEQLAEVVRMWQLAPEKG